MLDPAGWGSGLRLTHFKCQVQVPGTPPTPQPKALLSSPASAGLWLRTRFRHQTALGSLCGMLVADLVAEGKACQLELNPYKTGPTGAREIA